MNISMIGWGRPSSPKTFSGYSSTLAAALNSAGSLAEQYDAKVIQCGDLLDGAIRVVWQNQRPRIEISRAWMWRCSTEKKLSTRLAKEIVRRGDNGPFLQIGSFVTVPQDLGDHYVLTDMTIPQAHSAGRFAISSLSEDQLEEAIQVQQRVFDNAKHIFALSNWTKDGIVQGLGVSADKVTTVFAGPNLVPSRDLDEFQGARVGRKILFVGIDWERKGGPLLLDAFRICRQRFPDVQLTIVGCDPNIDEPGVKIAGYLDRRNSQQFQQLIRHYEQATCFCLPSHFDPFPNAILEASAFGLPTVSLDNGSRREVIENELTGHLAATASPEDLAEALLSVLGDEDACRKMGLKARSFQTENFSWDSVVRKIRNVALEGQICVK